jgi:hypothetical protein
MAGVLFAGLLGLVFTSGMVLTDALNGLWVARMMSGPAAASRWMSIGVALLCFAIAVLALLKHALPAAGELADAVSLPLGAATLLLITGIGAVALLRSRSSRPEAS